MAERFTRRSQKPLGAIPCGFESHLAHCLNKAASSGFIYLQTSDNIAVENPDGGDMDKPIKFTEKAIAKIKKDAEASEVPLEKIYLRIGITTITCCGFSYLLEFTREKMPNDFEMEVKGVRVLINRSFCSLFEDAEMDYVVTGNLLTTGLVFRNPNVRQICGCGETHPLDGEKS